MVSLLSDCGDDTLGKTEYELEDRNPKNNKKGEQPEQEREQHI